MRALAPLALTLLITACGDGESLLPADARLPDGGRYRGDVVNGVLQGKGRIDYPNGSWYAGNSPRVSGTVRASGTRATAMSTKAVSGTVCSTVRAR